VWYCTYLTMDYYSGTINKLDNEYSLEFERMNRSETYSFSLNKDDVLNISYQIDKGKCNLFVYDQDNNAIYQGNDIDNSNFELVIPHDGQYEILVEGKHAKGFVKIYKLEK